jgi:glucose-6-phosphate isomerase
MILTKRILFKNFKLKKKSRNLRKKLDQIIDQKNQNELIKSLCPNYKNDYLKKIIDRFKNDKSPIQLIGMGGSILGTKAIYNFLKKKVKKKIIFIDNLNFKIKHRPKQKKLNIIVSKSGNTLETIINANIFIKKNEKNIFITENKKNFLRNLALKMKSEIIDHNNFIGGRYSVLSEVGMLPSSLVGLDERKFKQFNNLIKNKKFLNHLIINTSNIIHYLKHKKFNSIIVNYDYESEDLFKWYQQLVAESLGKKQKGIMPILSLMPKDNHSLLQLYLDGPKNNFFTFFSVEEKNNIKIRENFKFSNIDYIKNKSISNILSIQKKASENVFSKKDIPFRSFEIKKRSEETLGELFTFFILETILLGHAMKIDPFNQPAVELIKKETKRILK